MNNLNLRTSSLQPNKTDIEDFPLMQILIIIGVALEIMVTFKNFSLKNKNKYLASCS